MARSRLPSPYAIWRIALHSISLVLCIIIIGSSSYAASFGHGYGARLVTRFIAAFWALAVDVAEIAALADAKRRVRRCPALYLCFLELLTIAICIVLPLLLYGVGASDHDCMNIPLGECEYEQDIRKLDRGLIAGLYSAIITALLHLILFITACVDYVAIRKENKTIG
ncbi:hypothetical protein B0T25DRAFT_575770 [Lasiosphaeria hispida]|uniref:MARVEL domain-containing protein n=1 Tax=Lasiosphaeria hispida TaxID=260671 RepID=A0AAJ0HUQ2_9PEZI|nr:hypothetical protein B0T25DRAFT_575770 [Lasiosphaeria hispida]